MKTIKKELKNISKMLLEKMKIGTRFLVKKDVCSKDEKKKINKKTLLLNQYILHID